MLVAPCESVEPSDANPTQDLEDVLKVASFSECLSYRLELKQNHWVNHWLIIMSHQVQHNNIIQHSTTI